MRRKVLLVQPSMQPPGGGNGVAAWMLQSIVHEHDVTVLSWWPVDVDPINRFFGTALRRSDFSRLAVPPAWRVVPDHLPVPASLLRSSLMMRYTRHVTDGFDVIVGVHNETDYGRRGIQYIHYPTYLRPRPQVDLRWYHFGPALDVYYSAADRLAKFSVERMKSNLTLVNSNWTGSRVRESLGIDAQTVYPPVVGGATPLPWSDRRRAFLAMGRLSPEKDYERVIRILVQVKKHAPEIALTIVCTYDRSTRAYYERLQALVASLDAGSWISFQHDLTREQVRALIASHRYGIHGMREEHFGMAPAEMVRGGMIVWVPNGGGQVEIVGDTPALRYDSEEEAVGNIVRVLNDDNEQRVLRERLADRAGLFSTEHFVNVTRQVITDFRE